MEVSRDLGIYNSMDFSADPEGTSAMWMKHRSASKRLYSRIPKGAAKSFEDFFTEEERRSK